MAESLGRLRLGAHSRTPTTPRSAHSNESEAPGDPQPGDCRRPSLSRVSSRLTSPETAFDSLPIPDDIAHIFIRNHDQVRYNPSLDQMVEAIQVFLMTRGVLEPLPIEYNSYVLHLVEGFAKAKRSLRKAETDYDELKETLDRNLELWLERESQFRAEVKRLEVLLSKASPDGLEAVALARANSVVDRSGPKSVAYLSGPIKGRRHNFDDSAVSPTLLTADQIPTTTETQANRARKCGKAVGARDLEQVPFPKILDNENDFLLSEKLRRLDAATEATTSSRGGRVGANLRHGNSSCGPPVVDPTMPVVAGHGETRAEAASPPDTHMNDDVSTNLSTSKPSRRSGVEPSTLPISASTRPTHAKHVDEAATPRQSSQQDGSHLGSSFEPGDDFDRLLDNTEKGQGHFDPGYGRQFPLRSRHWPLERSTTESRQCNAEEGIIFPADCSPDEKPNVSTGRNSSALHDCPYDAYTAMGGSTSKPVTERNEPGCGSKSPGGASRNPSNRNLISPVSKSTTGQANPQTQRAGMDARIAAARAVANAQGSTKQEK
ncbi:hypothetical protein F4861DRAFT_115508 [Xylaria intraflava]|nr:hypothetical protein F4861DRAFT_115508 [Xylaria intraflava]